MVLKKIVNGKEVDMSPEEEVAILAQWAENENENNADAILEQEKKNKINTALNKLLQGLTVEEVTLIKEFFIK